MHDVFISYSNKDKTVADEMCNYLENKGVRCWYAPRDVAPGADWAEAIVEAINAAKVFVIIYSAESNQSKQVKREVSAAADASCEIIPFKISAQEMNSNFQYYLKNVHWLDATLPPMKERLYQLYVRIRENVPEQQDVPAKKTKKTDKSGGKSPFEKIKAKVKKKNWGAAAGVIITALIIGLIWLAAEKQSADSTENVQSSSTNYEYVFGSNYKRADIKSVVFVDSLKDKPRNAWEVLEEADDTILAWVEEKDSGYTLYIGSDGKVSPKSCRSLFYNYTSLERIDFNDCFDTSQADDMSFMFSNCESLKEVDVTGFDTGLVKDMRCMFMSCASLEELDTSKFNTIYVSDMSNMFRECKMLSKLDVSGFDTSHVTDMSCMFQQCAFLTELDVSGFDTSYVTNMKCMFQSCEALTELDISNFNMEKVTDKEKMFANTRLGEQMP